MSAKGPKPRHTILLLQETTTKTRTYYDYENIPAATEGVCKLYEAKLKKQNPNKKNIVYNVTELFSWIDQLGDISCLVFNPDTKTYSPHDKEWIKKRALENLKRQMDQN